MTLIPDEPNEDTVNDFISQLKSGLSEDPKPQNYIVEEDDTDSLSSEDFITRHARSLVLKAYNDYMELSSQIQTGVVNPEIIHGAAQILASTNSLIDSLNKREMQKERIENERWKVERNIEGRKEINREKSQDSQMSIEAKDGDKTLKIAATRKEIMQMIFNKKNELVAESDVEVITGVREI
jgi:hypothetical protein